MRSSFCLCAYVSAFPLKLLGNGSVNAFRRQRIHMQQYKNCGRGVLHVVYVVSNSQCVVKRK
jgi:hypothetical protein